MSSLKCKMIELPKILEPRGNLTFIESCKHIPFDIKRVYYLYDVPGGAERGGHAHKALDERSRCHNEVAQSNFSKSARRGKKSGQRAIKERARGSPSLTVSCRLTGGGPWLVAHPTH